MVAVESVALTVAWNCRRYRDASELFLAFSSPDVLSSEDNSEKAHDERLEWGWVGERAGTMSRKSSKEKLEKGDVGGE